MSGEKQSYNAMIKFVNNEPLNDKEWEALSWLTLLNREKLEFGPDNVRWANSKKERESNLKFYKLLGVH